MSSVCRVSFDGESQQHLIEFDDVDESCTRLELASMAAWIRSGRIAVLSIDRGLDGELDSSTATLLERVLEPRLYSAIAACESSDNIEVGSRQAEILAAALADLAPQAELETTREATLDARQSAPITLSSNTPTELAGDSWVPVGIGRADLPHDSTRPATVMWRPPTGEFIVRLPTTSGGTWPRELWLRVTEEPDGWLIAAAPVAPDGEARTILARPSATFDGLRLDVDRSVSEGTAIDSRQSRSRLASLAAVATEAEQAGDFATAAAAWTAAAAFADEILDDSAAERFRARASDTSRRGPNPRKVRFRSGRWWILAVAVAAVIALIAWRVSSSDPVEKRGTPNTSENSTPEEPRSTTSTTPPTTLTPSTAAATTTPTSSLPVRVGTLRTRGTYTQSLGKGHGPLGATMSVELSSSKIGLGEPIQISFEFTYDDIGPYPANLYSECLAAVGKSRTTGGWKSEVPTYVVILPAADTTAGALHSYSADLPLSAYRNLKLGQVALADSRILNCGEPPAANTQFQVDQRLVFQIYSATLDIRDLPKGEYVVIPMMTATSSNQHGFPEAVNGDLVGFAVS